MRNEVIIKDDRSLSTAIRRNDDVIIAQWVTRHRSVVIRPRVCIRRSTHILPRHNEDLNKIAHLHLMLIAQDNYIKNITSFGMLRQDENHRLTVIP